MPQQQSSVDFFQNGSDGQGEFSVVLRGYDRNQVDSHIQRLMMQSQQAAQARDEAEARLNEAQRRARQAEQRLTSVEQKLTDTNKQLEENNRPTLSRVYSLEDTGQAALDVHHNKHQGKVGVLCLAPEEGLGVRDAETRARHLDAINAFRGV